MRISVMGPSGIAAAVLLTGCVAGQSLNVDYQPPVAVASGNDAGGAPVAVEVRDNRPYVTSGEKAPYYIGKYRAGFGNPWDVTTENREPLADVLKRNLGKDIEALGFRLVEPASAERRLAVSIDDWNFDGYQNGKFWYALKVDVFGRDETALATSRVSDTKGITGSLWKGAKGGFEKDMPKINAEVVTRIARDNPEVLHALNMPDPPAQ